METERLPWVFAVLTAAWFGWMAARAGRSWALWAVGGGVFGLVVSTLMLGLGRAASIPYSSHDEHMDRLKWIVTAAVLILVIGWMLTSSLHQLHLTIWRRLKTGSSQTSNPADAKVASVTATKPPGAPQA
jgi:hypothetical protein